MISAVQRFISAWQFVIKRSLAHWRLLSSVVLGVLLASSIMSGTVIYFDALREIALRSALSQHSEADLHIIMQGQRGPVNREEADRVSRVVDEAVQQRLEWLIDGRVRAAKTPTMFLTATGQEAVAGDDNARAYFAYIPDIEDRIVIRGGAPPSADAVNAPGEPFAVEAMIPVEAAETFGARIGDRVSAVLPWSDDLTHVEVVISGIFQRETPEAEVWQLEEEVLEAATGASFRTMPFHISEEAFLETLGPQLRRMEATYAWLLMTDADRVNARNSTDTLLDIRGTNAILSSTLSSFRQSTSLDNALDEYDRRLFFSKLPMFVVLVLIAIVILYYVATLSSLVVEDRRSEVALLRSRGANSTQILMVFVMEGLTIAALSVVFGPLLAAAAVSVLGLTPAFSDLGAGGILTVSLSGGAYMMAALGGLLSFVALIFPAFRASQMTVTQERQRSSRPTDLPFFQRYYLDVLLLIVGILLFRQLTEQGSIVARNLFGEIAVNQMLLAVPGIILVASAMVLLRLFPVVMNLISRLLSAWLPAGMVMGVWQMARNPAHYARLSLLLILTAGLGIFAASFSATLDRSFVERVLFFTGSDVRLNGNVPISSFRRDLSPDDQFKSTSILKERYEGMPGVDGVSLVRRSSGHDLSKLFGGTYDMVAVDPDSFLDVAWFRADFAGRPLSELLASLVHRRWTGGHSHTCGVEASQRKNQAGPTPPFRSDDGSGGGLPWQILHLPLEAIELRNMGRGERRPDGDWRERTALHRSHGAAEAGLDSDSGAQGRPTAPARFRPDRRDYGNDRGRRCDRHRAVRFCGGMEPIADDRDRHRGRAASVGRGIRRRVGVRALLVGRGGPRRRRGASFTGSSLRCRCSPARDSTKSAGIRSATSSTSQCRGIASLCGSWTSWSSSRR